MTYDLDQLNAASAGTLMESLGITYTSVSENCVKAVMPVNKRTCQPFGILHGGASLALAETVAGLGSMILCAPDETAVGMQVSGNHVSAAYEGDVVRAEATIVHKGKTSHVWDINIYASSDERLVSSVRVLNSVIKKK